MSKCQPIACGVLELIDVAGGFEGAEQEIVPDVLDRDLHAQLLRQRQHLANLLLRSLVAVGVADALVDDARARAGRWCRRAPCSRAAPVSSAFRVPRRGSLGSLWESVCRPVDRIDHPLNADAGGVAGLLDLVVGRAAGAVHFDAVEAGLLEHLELLQHAPVAADHPPHHRFLDGAAVLNGFGRGVNRPPADPCRWPGTVRRLHLTFRTSRRGMD